MIFDLVFTIIHQMNQPIVCPFGACLLATLQHRSFYLADHKPVAVMPREILTEALQCEIFLEDVTLSNELLEAGQDPGFPTASIGEKLVACHDPHV